ncbi:MAG: DUF3108 domain-containing protein [Desulfobacula sp.]|nr:DUF3108 domain-containing protein [Desulfobacula sp.]
MSICWVIERFPLLKPCIRKYIYFFFVLMTLDLLFLFFPAGSEAGTAENKLPFYVGEALTYNVRWEMIRAGKVDFLVRPFTIIDGKKAWHFDLKVRSNRYIDMFYKIRDRIEGFADEGFTKSLLYQKTQSGKDKKQIKVVFDWEHSNATYSNFGSRRDPIKIPAHTFDPISSFYMMRTLDFKEKQTLSFPITDGKKQFLQKVHIKERQTLDLSSGKVDTFLFVPEVNHFSGVFKRSENPTVRVWVTADEKKIPVRIKVKVFIGSVIFDLVSEY